MPSVYSFSRPRLWPSSTVMTPSLPTLSITSAMISPTSGIRGADRGDGRDLLAVVDRAGVLLDLGDDGLDGLLDAALDDHRVGAGGHDAEALGDHRLAEHDRGGRAVAGDVVGLGRDFLEELRAHVLERVVELDVASDRDAVVGDRRRAELLVEDDVAALGADRDLDGVGEAVDAPLERSTSGLVEDELLSQCRCPSRRRVWSWSRSARARRQSSTIARMSFWLTMRSSSPSTLNSVPAYLA